MTNISSALIGLAALLFLLLIVFGKENYMDFSTIVKSQLKLFRNNKLQYLLYYGIPAILGVGIALSTPLNVDIVENLNVIVSILVASLFSVLGIIVSWNYRKGSGSETTTREKEPNRNIWANELKNETVNSILFETIVCVIVLVLNFGAMFFDFNIPNIGLHILSGITYTLVFIALLQIFVIIKRLASLYNNTNN